MNPKLKAYHLRSIPPWLWEPFKEKAKSEGHSIREMILRLIEEYLARHRSP